MRAKLLCLLTLAATAAAGAASAERGGVPPSGHPGVISDGPDPRVLAPRPVFAVIGDHVVSGVLQVSEPLMALVDARDPTFSCAPSQEGAEITLSCSDGSSAQLKLQPSGCGRARRGEPASMCVGLKARYAVRRLTAPAGKVLRIDGARLVLEPMAGA